MKNNYQKLALLAAVLLTQGCEFGAENGSQSIEVSRTDLNYHFKAEFPKAKSSRVFSFIEREIKVGNVFKTDNDKLIKLTNGPKFHLTSRTGQIEIEFSKTDNSEASWKKLEKLCMDIKNELK